METTDIKEIEVMEADCKEMIKDHEAFQRLQKNRDFKRLFTEGYFKTNRLRLASMLSHPNCIARPEQKDRIVSELEGVNHMEIFLAQLEPLAEQAQAALDQADEIREQAAEEE